MAENVLNVLGRRITDGELPAGAVFTVAQIEEEFGAARSVVREAIGVLGSIGMVEPRRRVGVIVTEQDRWDPYDPHLIRWLLGGPQRSTHLEALMELRLAVEPLAARLAADRATPDERADLLRHAEVLHQLGERGQGNTQGYLEADIAFHSTLLRASGNPFLAGLATPVAEVLRGRTELGLTPGRPAAGTLEDHVAAARAIASHDPATASSRSTAHLETVRREVSTDASTDTTTDSTLDPDAETEA